MALRRYLPDGSVRGIWSDDFDARRALGAVPHRASHIEVVEDGPSTGLFYVDLSPLSALTGRTDYAVCLVRLFTKYEEARRAEVAWLMTNYVLEGAK